jgi:16S rRNA (guanine966-N2)-methyltransferase
MRIISGSAGSIPLQVPRSLTRPTTDRVRESLFAVLGDLVVGARVLDLFAGSGSLGIEALSRGAILADFIESHGPACESIQKNLEKAKLKGGKVHRRDVLAHLGTISVARYDLIFADPPYARSDAERELLEKLLNSPGLAATLSTGGLLVLESLSSSQLPETEFWKAREERTYGVTRVSFLAPVTRNP